MHACACRKWTGLSSAIPRAGGDNTGQNSAGACQYTVLGLFSWLLQRCMHNDMYEGLPEVNWPNLASTRNFPRPIKFTNFTNELNL